MTKSIFPFPPEPEPTTASLVFRTDDSRFQMLPNRLLETYREDLLIIAQEQVYLSTFLVVSAQVHWLRYLLIDGYPQQIRDFLSSSADGFSERYYLPIAKMLYIAYHLDTLYGGSLHIEAHKRLREMDIDPMLAHVLVRVMCSVTLTYGRAEALYHYGEWCHKASVAYNEWQTREYERGERQLRERDEERRDAVNDTASYGLYEDLEQEEDE